MNDSLADVHLVAKMNSIHSANETLMKKHPGALSSWRGHISL